MSELTLTDLLTVSTKEEIVSQLLQELSDAGFESSSWQDGQPELTLVNIAADNELARQQIVRTYARFLYLTTAYGDGLFLSGKSWLGVTRKPATKTQYTVTITNDSGVGPETIDAGDYQLTSEDEEQLYKNDSSFTLTAGVGDTVQFIVTCEVAGRNGNKVPSTLVVTTPIAGTSVSITLTTSGVDAESETNYLARCLATWPQLGENGELKGVGYASLITTNVENIHRVAIDNEAPRGDNTADIYCARANSTAETADLSAATALVEANQNSTGDYEVKACSVKSIDIVGTVSVLKSKLTDAFKNEMRLALTDFLTSLPIGGKKVGDFGYVVFADLLDVLDEGTESVALTSPTADTLVGSYEIVAPADADYPNLTFVAV